MSIKKNATPRVSKSAKLSAHGELPAIPAGVRLVTLDNGLTLILREDHSAPVVSAQAWCMAGSIHEGPWMRAGLSHLLEHMLFKGTTTRPASRIDQEVQEAGGSMNAYTSFDRTVYHINVPNTGAKVAIDILCDICRHATFPEDEMVKEKQVILREMDMNQDDPARRSSRRLFETAFTRSPYRHTIIGYPDVFNELKREDVLSYYREKYASNNLVFVVVGDMSVPEVEAQIRAAFADAKSRPMPPIAQPEEPSQIAPREIIEEAPIEMAYAHWSWHTPDVRHADTPVLDVLAALLGGGRSSRLYQNVREKAGLAHSLDAWTYNPGGIGLLGVSLVADTEKFEAARAAVLQEIERMKEKPVSKAELGKALKQCTASVLGLRKSMQGQAQDLGGGWMAANDLNFSQRALQTVKRVTPADIQRVAKRYLTAENRTFYALAPNGKIQPAVMAAPAVASQPICLFTLGNGLRLLIKEDHRLPFVEFRTVFKGGILVETPSNNGLTSLFSKMLLKGTTRRPGPQIASEIESLGGSIDNYSGNNSFGVNVEVMSEDFGTGLDLLADVLLHPSWPVAPLEMEREMQIASIKAMRDQLVYCASRAMRRVMFGDQGYGMDIVGTEESVAAFKVADLRLFHKALVAPNNCVLAIFGDVKTDRVRAEVLKAFKTWKTPAVLSQKASPAHWTGAPRVVETRDKKQVVVVIGFSGLSIDNPDKYALDLVQEACNDLGSRLFLRIRDQLGLAYYVGAINMMGVVPGYFAFYAGTAPEHAEQVEQEMLNEARSLVATGLTPEELSRAKAKIVGQKKIARQDLGAYAGSVALDELYGLGYRNSDAEDAKYEAVTVDMTREAARKYLTVGHHVVAVIKPE